MDTIKTIELADFKAITGWSNRRIGQVLGIGDGQIHLYMKGKTDFPIRYKATLYVEAVTHTKNLADKLGYTLKPKTK